MSDQAYVIKEKLAQLEQALIEGTPNMPTLLRDIHSKLRTDPDTVTLLTEEECTILVKGLKKQTNTEISGTALKAAKKRSAKVTLADL